MGMVLRCVPVVCPPTPGSLAHGAMWWYKADVYAACLAVIRAALPALQSGSKLVWPNAPIEAGPQAPRLWLSAPS